MRGRCWWDVIANAWVRLSGLCWRTFTHSRPLQEEMARQAQLASNASERGKEAHRRLKLELSRKALVKSLDERKRAEIAHRKVAIARPSQRVFQTQQRTMTTAKREHDMERAFEKVFTGAARRTGASLLRAQPSGWSQVPESSDTEHDTVSVGATNPTSRPSSPTQGLGSETRPQLVSQEGDTLPTQGESASARAPRNFPQFLPTLVAGARLHLRAFTHSARRRYSTSREPGQGPTRDGRD